MKLKQWSQRLRHVALICAAVFGLTAFGDDYFWSGTATSWSDDGAWTTSPANTSNYVINKDATITVTGNQSVTTGLFIENAAATIECTSGSSLTLNAAYVGTGMGDGALTLKTGNFVIGDGAINLSVWDNGVGSLTIDGASVAAPSWIRLGVWNTQVAKTASLTIKNGGSLSLWHIQSYLNGASTITLDGGSLVYYGTEKLGNNWEQGDNTVYGADGKTWQPVEQSVVIGSAGGTISVPENATVTVTASVKGVGTLTKTGAGTLVATGDMAGFIGKVAVAEGAGAVTLPANAARARAGDYTSKTENQDGTFTFAYDANGTAAESFAGASLSLDFEDSEAYDTGWAFSGSSNQHSQGLRADTGKSFLKIYGNGVGAGGTRTTLATYSKIPSLVNADSYEVTLDWYARVGYHNSTCYVRLLNDNVALFSIEAPNVENQKYTTAYVYGNPQGEALGSFAVAARDVDIDANGAYWYTVKISATKTDGVKLTVLKPGDLASNPTFGPTRVSDYLPFTKIAVQQESARGGDAHGGIDDILITVPAAVATIGDATFATFADAAAAAEGTSTIKLYSDIELDSSIELPYGATIDFNSYALYTRNSDVSVTFDDGMHCLASTTAGDYKVFSATEDYVDTVYVWVGESNSAWNAPANWQLAGVTTHDTLPAFNSTVIIPKGDGSPIVIKCPGSWGEGAFTGNLTIERDVTLQPSEGRAANQGIHLTKVSGSGTLTLEGWTKEDNAYYYFNVYGGDSSISEMVVECDLCIKGYVYLANSGSGDNKWTKSLRTRGALLGDGRISINGNVSQPGLLFDGDTTHFAGSYLGGSRNSWNRDGTRFNGTSSTGSALAYWKFGVEQNSNGADIGWPIHTAGTYEFGRLDAPYFRAHADGVTVKVGDLDGTSTVNGKLEYSSNKIVKVGDTSTLDLTLTEAKGSVEAEAGTLNLKGAVAPESLTITGAGATVTVENGNTAVPSLGTDLATGYQLVTATGEDATTYTVAAKCTITWKVDGQDDEVVQSYVGAEVSPAAAVRAGYEFDHWEPAVVSPATGNATYTAIWKAADVAVAQPVVTYGADYEKATVTADVTVTTPGDVTYELTVTKGGTSEKTYTGGKVANGTVTFENVEIPRTTDNIYADITYTVTPKSGSMALTPAATTEAPMEKTAWGFESKVDNSAVSSTGGSWGETAPVVKENKLSFTDGGTFTANSASSDDIVVITMDDICFGDVNAEDVEDAAQAGVRIGQSGDNYTFQVYTANNTWLDAAGSVTVDPEKTYDVVVTINYSTGKYSVAVDGNLLTAGSSTSFALAGTPEWTPKSVSAVEFCGEGSLTSIAGEAFDGNMVVDAKDNKFATIEAAIAALKAGTATAPLTLLHDGTAPQGWTINEKGVLVEASVVVETTADTVLVCVPQACKADALINLSNRTVGDVLQVYSATEQCYYTWALAQGDGDTLVWTPADSFKVAGDDKVTQHQKPASEETLTVGQAVWVTRVNAKNAIMLNGAYATADKTPVTVRSGWNLVAPVPQAGETTYSVASVAKPSNTEDKIVIPTTGAPINCQWKDDGWKYYRVYKPNGAKRAVAEWTEAPSVTAGTGFWYVSGDSDSKNVEL